MKTLKEIDREIADVHEVLNDSRIVLDREWREFLEDKLYQLYIDRRNHPDELMTEHEVLKYNSEQ